VGDIGERVNRSLYEWQIDNLFSWKKKLGIHDFYVLLSAKNKKAM
jgi:hypothetical protein